MLRLTRCLTTITFTTGLALLVGCGGDETDTGMPDTPTVGTDEAGNGGTPDEHVDPHDVPPTDEEIQAQRDKVATYAAAIEQIQEYRDTIRDETTAGEPAKAHRSLDMLDYVLEWLPEIAQESNVPREQWETIGSNAQTLRDAFNQVHANIDAGEAPDYAAVADQIDAAVDALAAVETTAEPEPTN